jgi:hypothetical protein
MAPNDVAKIRRTSEFRTGSHRNKAVALLALLFLAGFALLQHQGSARAQDSGMSTGESGPKLPDNQLDSLVAPIALYPDPLLSQALVASTYPLEIMQLQAFLNAYPLIKDKALGDTVAQKPWDPSVQALAIFPDAVTRLSGDLRWTTDLGNAFLAQPADVMGAIQRMRARAVQNEALATGEQHKVETEMLENGEQVITIEPADPEVIYVPYFDPTIAYGALPYPYPPIYYPPPGYYEPGKRLAFAVGVILGAAWNGGWGYAPSWGKGEINLNINNKYVRNSTRNNVTRTQIANAGGGTKWQHNPVHRGGAPYSNKALADRYGSMLGNLGGGDRLERSVPAVDPRELARPTTGPANTGDRVGQHISWSHGDPGAFNGGGRDVTRASSSRGAVSVRGGAGGGRGGGRRR